MEKNNVWLSHIEWLIVFVTLIGGFYALDSKIGGSNCRLDQFMLAWHEEAKDFHGRLEKLDMDYKAHLIYQHSQSIKDQ